MYWLIIMQIDTPKASLRLDDLNVTFVPEKVGNPNAMQITYENEGQTRNLFVYAEIPQVSNNFLTYNLTNTIQNYKANLIQSDRYLYQSIYVIFNSLSFSV